MLVAYQLMIMVKALLAHHQRTGADLKRWFGNHQPPARAGPALKAA